MTERITFDSLPEAVALLLKKVENIEALVGSRLSENHSEKATVWMSLAELREYLPDHPAATTVYSWVRNSTIPHYKNGKKLSFKKAEIDSWLNDGRCLTDSELEAAATDYINNRRATR